MRNKEALLNSSNIELYAPEGMVASINPQGAYLEFLRDGNGKDMLFPRQTTPNGKDRGGIPVCAPIFGPGGAVELAQHGFARNLHWNIEEYSLSHVLLSLEKPQLQDESLSHYADCAMKLQISVGKRRVLMVLDIVNNGSESFIASPGFHPYFPVGDRPADHASINDTISYEPDELAATQTVSAQSTIATIKTQAIEAQIESPELTVVVAWTDNPDAYICIEPTFAGDLDSDYNVPERTLEPGQRAQYSMRIEWSERS